jgi:hypothetical protein
VGHVYYYLEDIVPRMPGRFRGKRLIFTPAIVRYIFEGTPEQVCMCARASGASICIYTHKFTHVICIHSIHTHTLYLSLSLSLSLTHTHTHTHIMWIQIICMYVCMHVCMCVCQVCMYSCVCLCVCVCVCVCTTCIRTYIHTCMLLPLLPAFCVFQVAHLEPSWSTVPRLFLYPAFSARSFDFFLSCPPPRTRPPSLVLRRKHANKHTNSKKLITA